MQHRCGLAGVWWWGQGPMRGARPRAQLGLLLRSVGPLGRCGQAGRQAGRRCSSDTAVPRPWRSRSTGGQCLLGCAAHATPWSACSRAPRQVVQCLREGQQRQRPHRARPGAMLDDGLWPPLPAPPPLPPPPQDTLYRYDAANPAAAPRREWSVHLQVGGGAPSWGLWGWGPQPCTSRTGCVQPAQRTDNCNVKNQLEPATTTRPLRSGHAAFGGACCTSHGWQAPPFHTIPYHT